MPPVDAQSQMLQVCEQMECSHTIARFQSLKWTAKIGNLAQLDWETEAAGRPEHWELTVLMPMLVILLMAVMMV
jgi:hypothetical protein